MITIPAKMFASVALFIGEDRYNMNNVHINIGPEKSYIEATNAHAFCRHELDNIYTGEEKHILIAPTKDLLKACKAKGAEALEILEDLSVRVLDVRGNVSYILPVNAKTCEAGSFPDTDQLINKANKPEDFTGVEHISLSCSTLDLLKAAFGKDVVFTFTFTGEESLIKVSVYETEFFVIIMPMLNPDR